MRFCENIRNYFNFCIYLLAIRLTWMHAFGVFYLWRNLHHIRLRCWIRPHACSALRICWWWRWLQLRGYCSYRFWIYCACFIHVLWRSVYIPIRINDDTMSVRTYASICYFRISYWRRVKFYFVSICESYINYTCLWCVTTCVYTRVHDIKC